MEPSWEEELHDKSSEVLKIEINNWCNIMNRLGVKSTVRKEWANIFTTQIETTCQEMVMEMKAYQDDVLNKIEDALETSKQLCKDLQLNIPRFGSEKLPLLEEYQKVTDHIEMCKTLREKKCQEISLLKNQEMELCKVLGTAPRGIQNEPLPKNHEIDNFKGHIEKLEYLKFIRLEEFLTLKADIIKQVDELKYEPITDFEKLVLNPEDSLFNVTDNNMKNLKDFHSHVIEMYNEIEEIISEVRNEVKLLWKFLKEPTHGCDLFIITHSEINLEVLKAWRNELARLKSIKQENMEAYGKSLRQEVELLWEKCHFAESQRDFSINLNTNLVTENAITLYEKEVEKLQKYYSENCEILNLLEKYTQLSNQLNELQEKCAPNRFKNRGGQLLQEEKKRNALNKSLLKLEEHLKELGSKYEANNNKNFLSWGKTVNEIIGYNDEKKVMKSSAKKQMSAATPLSKNTNFISKESTSVKRNLVTSDVGQIKRRRILQEHNSNELPLYQEFESRIGEKTNSRSTIINRNN